MSNVLVIGLKYVVNISTGPRSTANSSLKPTVPISGFVNIEFMNGNILTKEFKFLAKNDDIYGKRKFDANKAQSIAAAVWNYYSAEAKIMGFVTLFH